MPLASAHVLHVQLTSHGSCVSQALWAEFAPDATVADPDSWLMSKLGSPVSPTDIVVNGSHSMHGVDDDGISVQGYGSRYNWEQLSIRRVHTRHTPVHRACICTTVSSAPGLPCTACFASPACAVSPAAA